MHGNFIINHLHVILVIAFIIILIFCSSIPAMHVETYTVEDVYEADRLARELVIKYAK
jgi:hypothetical protein